MGAGLLSAAGQQPPGQAPIVAAHPAVSDMVTREKSSPAVNCTDTQLPLDPTPALVPDRGPHSNHNTYADHAPVTGVRLWESGSPVDTGLSAALDYTGVVVERGGEGRAAVGHGIQCTS